MAQDLRVVVTDTGREMVTRHLNTTFGVHPEIRERDREGQTILFYRAVETPGQFTMAVVLLTDVISCEVWQRWHSRNSNPT